MENVEPTKWYDISIHGYIFNLKLFPSEVMPYVRTAKYLLPIELSDYGHHLSHKIYLCIFLTTFLSCQMHTYRQPLCFGIGGKSLTHLCIRTCGEAFSKILWRVQDFMNTITLLVNLNLKCTVEHNKISINLIYARQKQFSATKLQLC